MSIHTALLMLWHDKLRMATAMGGVATAVFLSAAQLGLLVGWANTSSAIIRHSGVDIWVMTKTTPAFEYGMPIPRTRVHQTRSVPGVRWAEGMFMAWNYLQRPSGGFENIEIVGLDDDCAGGPWKMADGQVADVHRDYGIIIDELFLEKFQVASVGEEVEIFGKRAVVRGISRDVRTLTAAPFVFTSLRSAIEFDRRYRHDEVTYVLVRVEPGADPKKVAKKIEQTVPHIEALTTDEFAWRTIRYWMVETGLGLTVALTAGLGLVVGTLIVSQTLAAITQSHLANYATLLALGFSRARLAMIVVIQSMVIGGAGIILGSVGFAIAARLSARTPIPLETTPVVFGLLVALAIVSCLAGSFFAIRALWRIDPVTVFGAQS